MIYKKVALGLLLIITGLSLLYFFTTHQTHEITAGKSTSGVAYWLKDTTSWTPLMHAAHEGNAQKIQDLITLGADVNAKPEIPQNWVGPMHRLSPLALAILAKSLDSARILLNAGADVQDIFGSEYPGVGIPILGFALDSGSRDIIKMVIEAGANVNQLIEGGIFSKKNEGIRNNPLLTYAIAHKMPREVIQLLIQHGADVNQMDNFKAFSPLHVAAATGQADIVSDLLASGADKNLKNADGKTPEDFARKYGYQDILELIKKKGNK